MMSNTKIHPKWKFRTEQVNNAECWECNTTTLQHHKIYDTKTVAIAISRCKKCGSERAQEVCPVCLNEIELTDEEISFTGGRCWGCFNEAVSDNPELYV